MPEGNSGVNAVDPAATEDEPSRLPNRSQSARAVLRLVFLGGVFALIFCLSHPYPLLDRTGTTTGLLAVCVCAGVILFGVPRDAVIIAKDVLLAIFPCFLMMAALANGLFDSSQEILHQTVVVRTVYGRGGGSLIVRSWRPAKSTESLPLSRPFLFGRRGFYFPGQSITVGTRSGALGMPWVTRISR